MTSSGFADGLGRRVLAFDREEGVMLERLTLRPELGAFEAMLRDRLDKLAALEDERIARPRTIERDLDGSLVVASEFVPGSRLAELLETAAETGATPGVDAALGFLLDVLPALCGLHAGAGFAHGSIAPSRTVLTPAGQIVLLDAIYGGALTHLRYSRRKLWSDFTVATAPRLAAKRLQVETDVVQAAMSAVMLVLGRPLAGNEYPDGIAAVVREVIDVAQIRGSADFAAGFKSFLHRAFQLAGEPAYTAADDALFDVRQLAGELGVPACRRALADFVEQMESPSQPRRSGPADELADEIARFGLAAAYQDVAEIGEQEQDLDAHVDAELDIDGLVENETSGQNELTSIEIFDEVVGSGSRGEEAVDWIAAAAESTREEARLVPQAEPEPSLGAPVTMRAADSRPLIADPFPAIAPAPESVAPAPDPADLPVSAPELSATEQTAAPDVDEPAAAVNTSPDGVDEADEDVLDTVPAVATVAEAVPAVRSRRAKRATRSARARKDKLRSAAEHEVPALTQASTPAPAPIPAPPPQKPSSPWLVAPNTAAAFNPPVMDATPAAPVFVPIPTPSTTQGLPATPHFAQTPPVPIYTPPPMPAPPPAVLAPPAIESAFSRAVGTVAPSYEAPPAWTPPAPQPLVQVKMKDSGSRPRATRSETPLNIYSTPVAAVETPAAASAFPWKMVAALVIIVVGAIIGGRAYLPAKGVTAQEQVDEVPATAATAAPPAAAIPASVPTATTGRIEIESQPAGARVLLDGKAAGESPVVLENISAGRHTVTLVSSSGSIKRTIRVEAGRTSKIDVPIFSGWVGIFAPFVIQVSESGKVIGTTEESRIMLTPGRHELTLVNQELGYRASRTVDIEPGEVRSITLDPRGPANFNASPWAEVLIDGRKVGDTPIANLQLPLGTREVTFRHPKLGERRVSVTVKGDAPVAVSIDLTKPGL